MPLTRSTYSRQHKTENTSNIPVKPKNPLQDVRRGGGTSQDMPTMLEKIVNLPKNASSSSQDPKNILLNTKSRIPLGKLDKNYTKRFQNFYNNAGKLNTNNLNTNKQLPNKNKISGLLAPRKTYGVRENEDKENEIATKTKNSHKMPIIAESKGSSGIAKKALSTGRETPQINIELPPEKTKSATSATSTVLIGVEATTNDKTPNLKPILDEIILEKTDIEESEQAKLLEKETQMTLKELPEGKEALKTIKNNFKIYEDPTLENRPEDIDDIDKVYPCAETGGMDTITENFNYLKYLEQTDPISVQFLETSEKIPKPQNQTLVDKRMRIILLDWLINCNLKLKLRKQTLFLGINILDRFIDKCNNLKSREELQKKTENSQNLSMNEKNQKQIYVSKDNLQLVGISAFILATKYEEVQFPILDDWVWLSAESTKRPDIIQMEIKILRALNFDLSQPSPLDFLRRYSMIANANQKTHILAKFLIESGFYCEKISRTLQSKRAASCLYFALKLIEDEKNTNSPENPNIWTKELAYYSNYKETELLENVKNTAISLISSINCIYSKKKNSNPKGTSVFIKYCSPDHMRIARDKIICVKTSKGIIINNLIKKYSQGEFQN